MDLAVFGQKPIQDGRRLRLNFNLYMSISPGLGQVQQVLELEESRRAPGVVIIGGDRGRTALGRKSGRGGVAGGRPGHIDHVFSVDRSIS